MKIVFVAAGSAGDVHPFLAFGKILRARGHDVVLFSAAEFREGARHAGLRFEESLSTERFESLMNDPRLWDSKRAFPFLVREAAIPALEDCVAKIRAEVSDSQAVLAGSTLDLAARTVRELDGTPLVTIHMSPAPLRTVHRMPVFEGMAFVNVLPQWARHGFWWLADRVLDPQYVPQLNEARAAFGLGGLSRPLKSWWNSPDRILGLWPEWFGPLQPDFPSTLRLTGFPFGGDDHAPLDAELAHWLGEDDPPIVFTHGSANIQSARFFEVSAEVVRELGCRALFVTRRSQDVPTALPEGVRHATYAPFGSVLPHAAALVSHGGIGTIAEGLRAGVPQLVVPMAHDQYDNASRLAELGVALWIASPRYSVGKATGAIELILGEGIRRNAVELGTRLLPADGASRVADEIEALVQDG